MMWGRVRQSMPYPPWGGRGGELATASLCRHRGVEPEQRSFRRMIGAVNGEAEPGAAPHSARSPSCCADSLRGVSFPHALRPAGSAFRPRAPGRGSGCGRYTAAAPRPDRAPAAAYRLPESRPTGPPPPEFPPAAPGNHRPAPHVRGGAGADAAASRCRHRRSRQRFGQSVQPAPGRPAAGRRLPSARPARRRAAAGPPAPAAAMPPARAFRPAPRGAPAHAGRAVVPQTDGLRCLPLGFADEPAMRFRPAGLGRLAPIDPGHRIAGDEAGGIARNCHPNRPAGDRARPAPR